jgi:hypothetical protein
MFSPEMPGALYANPNSPYRQPRRPRHEHEREADRPGSDGAPLLLYLAHQTAETRTGQTLHHDEFGQAWPR